MGYYRAGFEVVGVDHKPQPHYPFRFVQEDAFEYMVWFCGAEPSAKRDCCAGHQRFSAVHASPPCQAYATGPRNTNMQLGREYQHPMLIEPVRELLQATGLPYVIENVAGAPLEKQLVLCGTSFGLPLRRHRHFESNVMLFGLPCRHDQFTEAKYWTGWTQGGRTKGNKRRATTVQIYGNAGEKHEWPDAMGIDWMTYDELAEAIPPAYTELIGAQLLPHTQT